jgi:cell division protein FtsQ
MTQAVSRVPLKRMLPSSTFIALAIMLATTIAGTAWLVAKFSDPAALPIQKVSVEGEFTHLDPDVLQAAVVDAVDAGFLGVNVAEIRERLLDEPWIREATIRRIWPDALHVRIVEQTPAARWGEQGMLNEIGDLFAPSHEEIPNDLVQLRGPLGSETEVLREYRYLAREIAEVGLEVVAVNVSDRHAWVVNTRDGKEIVLGRKDLHLRLQRFLFGYEHGLRDAWQRIGRVDLRYTNGFAVGENHAKSGTG